MDKSRYAGVFPAFYACYDEQGNVSTERSKALAAYLNDKGVKGLYVGGSSGECIYQGVEERKQVLEAVMETVGGKMTVIAHVACNNTRDSQELARHAESLGVDAIAAIPPIYFHLPPYAIADYWNDISAAAPNTDFFIYNIPTLAGVALTVPLLKEMLKNPRCVGVKNSSAPTQDIQMWQDCGGEDFIVMNGPDEQFISGLAIGATGGIGGTYAVMPELFNRMFELVNAGRIAEARTFQYDACNFIYKACSGKCNMYAMLKQVLKLQGIDIGSVRKPLTALTPADEPIAEEVFRMIETAKAKLNG